MQLHTWRFWVEDSLNDLLYRSGNLGSEKLRGFSEDCAYNHESWLLKSICHYLQVPSNNPQDIWPLISPYLTDTQDCSSSWLGYSFPFFLKSRLLEFKTIFSHLTHGRHLFSKLNCELTARVTSDNRNDLAGSSHCPSTLSSCLRHYYWGAFDKSSMVKVFQEANTYLLYSIST